MTTALTIQRDDLLPGRNLIGRWQEGAEGRWLDVSDPATNTVFARVPDSGAVYTFGPEHSTSHVGK